VRPEKSCNCESFSTSLARGRSVPVLTAAMLVRNLTSIFVALPAAAAFASAQVSSILPFRATGALLIGDAQSGAVLRADDADGDGLFLGAGELAPYFDPAASIDPATGQLYGSLGEPSAISCSLQGEICVVFQSLSPVAVMLRDRNGDGDAMDPGESRMFVNGAALAPLSLGFCRGAAFDPSGALWLTVDGPSNDWVVVLRDLDQDGTAHGVGELTVAYDDAIAATNGNPPLFSLSAFGFLPDGVPYATNASFFHKFTVRFVDSNADGILHDAGEVIPAYQSGGGNPQQGTARFAGIGADRGLLIYNSASKQLISARDNNGNSIYDDVGEAVVFAASGDAGLLWGTGGALGFGGDTSVYYADRAAASRILRFVDLSNDGDARDLGEIAVAIEFAASAFPSVQPSALFALPKEPAAFGAGTATGSFGPVELRWSEADGLPVSGNSAFSLSIAGAPAGAPIGMLYSSAATAIQLELLAPGISDLSSFIFVDLAAGDVGAFGVPGTTDASGAAAVPIPIGATSPPLAGKTFFVQALLVDGGSPLPVALSNGLSITLL